MSDDIFGPEMIDKINRDDAACIEAVAEYLSVDARCDICGRPLDDPKDPLWSRNMGGECLTCMAACGDLDAVAALPAFDPKPAPPERAWGFMENGVFVELPKMPMERAGLGPPPFNVKLPTGETRTVIEDPMP